MFGKYLGFHSKALLRHIAWESKFRVLEVPSLAVGLGRGPALAPFGTSIMNEM